MNLKLVLFLLIFIPSSILFAQDSDEKKKEKKEELTISDTLGNVFRPRVGLGMGILSYYGEIQNNHKGQNSFAARMGYHATLSAPLTRYFRLEFSFMFGQTSANERTIERNLNFKSRIRSGSIQLTYNFYPLIPQKVTKIFNPFIGVGFTGFEFLSKTDMKDKYGNTYNYWSDGSIRDLPESSPYSHLANEIQRDYTFETDLREQNLDGLGKYRESSFAIPLTFGFEFHLSPRVDFRISTMWNLTFTDLIDNYTYQGEGTRQGDKRKDQLLYTSFSLSYDLVFNKPSSERTIREPEFNLEDMIVYDSTDTDQDGVFDLLDDCAWTPIEAEVDERGCPIDTDQDGVPDYRDDEPYFTLEGALVDELGVTLTDEDLELRWLKFTDSTGEYVEYINEYSSYAFNGSERRKTTDRPTGKKSFVVIIGKEQKDVAANDLHKYLSYKEFETVVRNDTVYYVLGNYENIEDAIAARRTLVDKGVDVKEIASIKEGRDKIIAIKGVVINKIDSLNQIKGHTVEIPENENEINYRVQIGAFSKRVDPSKVFPGVKDVTFTTAEDGLTRYFTANTNDFNQAVIAKNNLREKGFSSAFVVAYKNGKRVTIEQAGIKTTESYSAAKELETFTESELPEVAKSLIKFRVKVGEFTNEVPMDILDVYLQVGGIKPLKLSDGVIIYYTKTYDSIEEAEEKRKSLVQKGLKESKIIGDNNGTIISKEEAIKLLDQNK